MDVKGNYLKIDTSRCSMWMCQSAAVDKLMARRFLTNDIRVLCDVDNYGWRTHIIYQELYAFEEAGCAERR